jgi:hypothetical protein
MKTKKVTELEYGDKIEMLSGFIRTVKMVEFANDKDARIYYVEGGYTFVLSNEEIELH